MAEFTLSTTASFIEVLDVLHKLQSVGFCSDLDAPSNQLGEENLGPFFDRLLSVFLRKIHRTEDMRPIPVLLGDGQAVDLFRLYLVVREKGGYDSVTRSRLWESVPKVIGLDLEVGSSLKLIYVKYLQVFDQWLQRILGKTNALRCGDKAHSGFLVRVSGMERDQRGKECASVTKLVSKGDQFLTAVRDNEQTLKPADRQIRFEHAKALKMVFANREVPHLKRKRETLVGMLCWVRSLARNPNIGDPSISNLRPTDGAESKFHRVVEYLTLAVQMRQAMFLKKIQTTSPDYSSVQKSQGSIDGHSQTEAKKRCSQRLQSSASESSSCSYSKLIMPDDQIDIKTQSSDFKMLDTLIGRRFDDDQQHWINVGPHFQAEVPDWTGQPSVSLTDPNVLKWLGIRIWPPENQEKRASYNEDVIGSGRRYEHGCVYPGSVECVRFHVAEERMQLKRELGPTFNAWGFDRMGEEVALPWTEEEEQIFNSISDKNSTSPGKNILDQLHLCIPLKGRKDLLSYYFNVFLLRKRSYQNRLAPDNIDSDDEDAKFDFLSTNLDHRAYRFCCSVPKLLS